MGVKNANYKEFRVEQRAREREGRREVVKEGQTSRETWPCSVQQETGHIVEAG